MGQRSVFHSRPHGAFLDLKVQRRHKPFTHSLTGGWRWQRQWWLLHTGEEKEPCRNVTLHFSASTFLWVWTSFSL